MSSQHKINGCITRVRPNPSLNHRTPNGGLSWPGLAVRGTFSPARAKPSHRRGPVSSNVRPHRAAVSVLPPPGRIIVLNGTSSAGKTALAAELQRSAPELQLLHVQLDAFRAMEPPGYWSADYKQQASLRTEALCRAINHSVAQYARFGQNVILDHVLTPKACRLLMEDLAGYQVLLVKIGCSLKQLELREARRKDRTPGLAKSQLESVHAGCTYDFEVDTTSTSATELAHGLAAWLHTNPATSAFRLMQNTNAA